MPKYIALLRAINVGGHIVKMDHLRSLFEGLGFSKVETFIASGNVAFDSRSKDAGALEKKIEKTLQDALGYEVRTFIRSPAELAEIAAYNPFEVGELEADGAALFVAFLERTPSEEAKQKLQHYIGANDELHVSGRELYWLCRTRMVESKFSGARLEKLLEMKCTFRNSTTVRKLASKYPA